MSARTARRLPTLSGLGHAIACPGSLALPRPAASAGAAARLGTAIHAWIEHDIAGGPLTTAELAEAHQLEPDDAGRLAYLAQHLQLRLPAGVSTEIALGYWRGAAGPRVDRVVGGAGSYQDHGQALSGTIDALWSEPAPLDEGRCPPTSTLWVVDWKTGSDEHVPPPDRNWQLRGGAVMAARWTGARKVRAAICYVNAAEASAAAARGEAYEGRWEIGPVWDEADLASIEAELLRALDSLDGGILRTGPQCDWCASRAACPALATAAVSLARADGAAVAEGAPLDADAATRLVGVLAAIRRAADAAEVALRAYAGTHGPIPLSDGRVWGPAAEDATTYRPGPTLEVLSRVVGPQRAMAAASIGTEALRRAVAGEGRGAWPRLRAELEAAGAVEMRSREVWRRRWPEGGEGKGGT